jgi:hypothetical protein
VPRFVVARRPALPPRSIPAQNRRQNPLRAVTQTAPPRRHTDRLRRRDCAAGGAGAGARGWRWLQALLRRVRMGGLPTPVRGDGCAARRHQAAQGRPAVRRARPPRGQEEGRGRAVQRRGQERLLEEAGAEVQGPGEHQAHYP